MNRVGTFGVRTPKPVAWAWHGRPFYKGCLITQEVPGHRTLADLALKDEEAAIDLLPVLDEQIRLLIEHRILHVDLHPGNVLVDNKNQIYIVDFDRAREELGSADALRDQYILRWRRAVIKHQLPEVLNEVMCAKLRTHSPCMQP
jgi:3-deoxy-D-manno-octulosonic acid kinase